MVLVPGGDFGWFLFMLLLYFQFACLFIRLPEVVVTEKLLRRSRVNGGGAALKNFCNPEGRLRRVKGRLN